MGTPRAGAGGCLVSATMCASRAGSRGRDVSRDAWVATRLSASNARQAMALPTSADSRFSLLALHLRSANDVGHIDPSSKRAVSLKPIEL